MDVKVGADGGKNLHVTVSGLVVKAYSKPVPIFLFRDVNGSPTKLRLDGIQFAIQEKMGFNLWWIMPDEEGVPHLKLIMPIESRGGFDFEKTKPISSPEGALGIALTAFKVTEANMTYMIMLDMTKQ